MKNDGRLNRCYLKGAVGDAINVVMVAAGHNLRKILNKLRLDGIFYQTRTISRFKPGLMSGLKRYYSG